DERERVREARRALGPAAARMAPPPPRALVIDERMPSPDRDAGSAAILSHVSALRRLGYEVSVAAAEAGWTDGTDTAAVRAAGAITCDRACFGTVEELLRRQSGCFDVVYLHRVGIAAAYGSLVRRTMPRARLLYGVADLHHLRFRRQAAVQNRPELLGLANRVRLEECTAAWQADAVLTHSGAEAELLRRMVPGAKVYEVPWAFTPRDEDEAGPGFAERSGLVFLGNYGHEPNEDAARWLVEELMPLVWARQPGLTCILAGRDMTPRIHALGRPGVEILGAVSELRPLWDRVRLSVAPLRFGAGVKGKVLDSFAAGVPCVMTPVAAEGLELPPSLSSWVAAEPRELAELILRMHDDRGAHLRARAAGLDLLRDRHDESDVAEALLAAIEGRPPATGIAGTAPAAA
ncbi:MAG: glycosyltransferase, partial [Gluconacetobacter diazotrophicus]|nr:glycosyltransferase [Gluconacetobacter diazotrophicus]